MSAPRENATPESVSCPAVFIAAPASGQGKTTITAALARLLRNQGKVVRVFKTGPDYLDPQVLAQASGQPVDQLDLWMAGETYCRRRLFEAARSADVILIEGAMGIFDGEPSSADLAARFGVPMLIVMDVKGMAQTAAALVSGIARFREDVQVGLLANACASARHRELIEHALPDDVPLLAAIARDPDLVLPERHLGLVQASEVQDDLECRFEAGAKALASEALVEALMALPPVVFEAPLDDPFVNLPSMTGITVGIARDAAFSFIYASNLDLLQQMGAELRYFSPIKDTCVPECDALWLPGGYPELYAASLSANRDMTSSLRAFFVANKPILAECGGLLYCLESLTDYNEETHDMLGLLPGQGIMRGRRGCQGMQTAVFPEGRVRGHAHHRSISNGTPEPIAFGERQRHTAPGEPIFRAGCLTASYLHLFFPDNPEALARLFSLRPSRQGCDPIDTRSFPDAVE